MENKFTMESTCSYCLYEDYKYLTTIDSVLLQGFKCINNKACINNNIFSNQIHYIIGPEGFLDSYEVIRKSKHSDNTNVKFLFLTWALPKY